jgi:hypothetical protein
MHTGHAVRTGTSKEGLTERTGSQDKQERYSDRIGMPTRHAVGTVKPRRKDWRRGYTARTSRRDTQTG